MIYPRIKVLSLRAFDPLHPPGHLFSLIRRRLSGRKDIVDRFYKLRDKVLEKRPSLKEILRDHGNESLYSYIKSYTATPRPAAYTDRQGVKVGKKVAKGS